MTLRCVQLFGSEVRCTSLCRLCGGTGWRSLAAGGESAANVVSNVLKELAAQIAVAESAQVFLKNECVGDGWGVVCKTGAGDS